MTKLHNPLAILHSGQICCKYWEAAPPHCPRPEDVIFRDCKGTIMHSSSEAAWSHWLSTARIVPFREQDEIKKIAVGVFPDSIKFGIPLDSIAERITIQDGMAVINQVEVVESDPLWMQWVKEAYPSMYRDNDYAELDYTDIEDFNFWINKQFTLKRKTNE